MIYRSLAERPPPERVNIALAALHLAINLYQFLLLPLLLMPISPWWALTLIPLVAVNNPLWSLLHETVHGSFHRSARVNRLAGRALGVAFASPWRVLRTGHLLHHRLNRTPADRNEAYDPETTTALRAAPAYYYQLVIGLYLSQVLSSFAFFLPQRLLDWARPRFLDPDSYSGKAAAILTRPDSLAEIRVDGAQIWLLLGCSFWAYGSWWWLAPLILAVRCICISFLDYVYHYDSPVDRLLHAYNLSLPAPLAGALLNFNLHAVHHRHPNLSWRWLPEAFRMQGDVYHASYLDAALHQLRGRFLCRAWPICKHTDTDSKQVFHGADHEPPSKRHALSIAWRRSAAAERQEGERRCARRRGNSATERWIRRKSCGSWHHAVWPSSAAWTRPDASNARSCS